MAQNNLDPAVQKALPRGCKVINVGEHGYTNWTAGYKVDVEVNGKEQGFFLKVCFRPQHAEMALGEFESQKALVKDLPNNATEPTAFGTFNEEIWPNPTQLVDVLAKLHNSSISPAGKFVFHVTTFNGYVPLRNECCDSWEEWFSRQFRSVIEWECSMRGTDPKFDKVAEEFFEKVIPRLLRPLQSGGRTIEPALVHSDLWEGNAQIDEDTNEVILFDSCCCYAHNEMELHMMRKTGLFKLKEDHVNKYTEVIPRSKPENDFEDRRTLYSMRDNIINSGLYETRAFLRDEYVTSR